MDAQDNDYVGVPLSMTKSSALLESGYNKLNASKQEVLVYSFVHIGSKEEILAPHPSCFCVVTTQEATAYGVPLYHFVLGVTAVARGRPNYSLGLTLYY